MKYITLAFISGALALLMILIWMWSSDPAPLPRADIGHGIKVPTYLSGPRSHSWWAMVVLLVVAGSLYLSFVFSYLFIWTVSPQVWPKPEQMPPSWWPILAAILLAASSGLMLLAGRLLPSRSGVAFIGAIAVAVLLLGGALGADVLSHWRAGLRPDADAHGAFAYMAAFLQLQLVLALVVMGGFAIARRLAGMLNRRRRVVFDNLALLWHYTVAQGLFGLLLVHGFPRIA